MRLFGGNANYNVNVQNMLSYYSCMGLCQSTTHVVVLLVYGFMSKYKTCCRTTRVLSAATVTTPLFFRNVCIWCGVPFGVNPVLGFGYYVASLFVDSCICSSNNCSI